MTTEQKAEKIGVLAGLILSQLYASGTTVPPDVVISALGFAAHLVDQSEELLEE